MNTKAFFKSLILMVIFASYAKAQYNSIGFGLGTSSFRGETSNDEEFLLDELGVSAYAFYSYWLENNSQWQIIGRLNYNQINAKIDIIVNDTGVAVPYQTNSTMFFIESGIRYYLDSDLNRYVPENGQGGFFGGILVGANLFSNNINAPRIGNDSTIVLSEKLQVSPSIIMEVGYRIFYTRYWAIEATIGFRHGFDDLWDGIAGHTRFNDWIVNGSVGFSYSF